MKKQSGHRNTATPSYTDYELKQTQTFSHTSICRTEDVCLDGMWHSTEALAVFLFNTKVHNRTEEQQLSYSAYNERSFFGVKTAEERNYSH
jgi:hypothetical protein